MSYPICDNYPSPSNATTAPRPFWPVSDDNSNYSVLTGPARSCVSHPEVYVHTCCGRAHKGAAFNKTVCNWNVCVSSTTDAEWEACFKATIAEYANTTEGAPGNGNYSFNCITFDESSAQTAHSGARRTVVTGCVFAIACAAIAVAV